MYSSLILAAIFFIWSTLLNFISGLLVCRSKKLFLFPFFESFMTISFILLWQTSTHFISDFILFSALAITLSTDLSCMLISRFVSLYLAPTGIILSFYDLLAISWLESVIASCLGYLFFYGINKLFFMIKKQNGIGQGDFDLMALIGAYTGILGIWFTVLCGSIIGTICALVLIAKGKKSLFYIPFGPFLSISAMIWILFQNQVIDTMLY